MQLTVLGQLDMKIAEQLFELRFGSSWHSTRKAQLDDELVAFYWRRAGTAEYKTLAWSDRK